MLIIAPDAAYHLPLNPQGPPPTLPEAVVEGQALRLAAEGRRHRVLVTADNRLLIQSGGHASQMPSGIEETITSLAILQEQPLTLVLGTEPPRVYRLLPGAGEPRASMSFDRLPARAGWHTPWGGPPAVRSLAVTSDGWVYANIHVGSIMRSADGGIIWEPVTPTLHEDVHQVAVSAGGAKGVYANTANGVWISRDRGDSWAYVGDRLGGRYGRAIAVHPKDPAVMLATTSDGPHGDDVHARLYRTEDGGYNWRQVVDGLVASTAANIDTHQIVFDARGDGWAIVGEQLYHGRFAGRQWKPYWRAPQPLLMVTAYG
ncbi:MAG: WD40/YVTN/BNR-like repeat-containing protein [Anaerolineae bacterium]|jgi:hypothetical protein